MKVEWVNGSEHQAPYCRVFNHNHVNITHFSSHEDREEWYVRGRGPCRDDLSHLKIKAPEFDGNLKQKNYNWIQAI